MNSIIEALYMEQLNFADRPAPTAPAYQQTNTRYKQECLAFQDTLKDLDMTLFDTFDHLCSQNATLAFYREANVFQLGFCLGVAIMQEVSQHMEKLA